MSQDLDSADIEYSYKHPTLFTITVQGRVLANQPPTSSPLQDISQWHLPSSDVHSSEARYMFRLHTVELYFWTAEDAELFVDSLKRVLIPGQLRILDANTTHPEHRDSMSPVVQLLEKAAVTGPPNSQAQQLAQAQRSNSISTTHTTNSTAAVAAGAPAAQLHTPVSPPTSPPMAEAVQAIPQPQIAQPTPQPPGPPPPAAQALPQAFAPMAYNPAAPAAPEPIAHREKTPPPPDAEGGTGLGAVATHEAGTRFHPQQQQQPGFMMQHNPLQQSFGPQPTGGSYAPGPPQAQAIQRANTIAQPPSAVPSAISAPPPQQPSPYQQSFAGPLTQATPDPNAHLYAQQHQQQQGSPAPGGLTRQSTLPLGGYAPQGYAGQQQQQPGAQYGYSPGPPGTPGMGPQSSGMYQGHPQQGQPQSGYYHPGQAASQQQHQGYGVNHGMHQQVYIPDGQQTPAQAGPGQQGINTSLEGKLKNAEKGVSGGLNKLFKRLDKKI